MMRIALLQHSSTRHVSQREPSAMFMPRHATQVTWRAGYLEIHIPARGAKHGAEGVVGDIADVFKMRVVDLKHRVGVCDGPLLQAAAGAACISG